MLILHKEIEVNIIGPKENAGGISNELDLYNPECYEYPENEPCDWAELCANDEAFYYPVIDGDYIYMQFQAPLPQLPIEECIWRTNTMDCNHNYLYDIKIIDVETEDSIHYADSVSSSYGGGYYNYIPYEWIKINTGLIPYSCFVIDFISHSQDTGIDYHYYSEVYRKIDCEKIETVLLRGLYCDFDSENNIYIEFSEGEYIQNNNNFELNMRLRGELVKTSISIEQEFTEDILQTLTSKNNYKLRLHRIPERIVDKLALLLSAKTKYINGIQIINISNIEKNYDEGADWFIEMELTGVKTENDFTCNEKCKGVCGNDLFA